MTMKKLVFLRMVNKFTLLALVAMLIVAYFSQTRSDYLKISENRDFSRRLLVLKSKFTSPGFSRTVYNNRRTGAPVTHDSVGVMFHSVPSTPNPIQNKYAPVTHDSVGVMFHSAPSTPNPIQNKYPRYRHH